MEFNYQAVEKHILDQGLLEYMTPTYDRLCWPPAITKLTPLDILFNGNISDLVYDILKNSDYNYSYCNGEELCSPKGRRSITDIFRLAKFYHSDLTLEQVYMALIDCLHGAKLNSYICPDICRRVWTTYENPKGFLNGVPTDEFKFDFSPYGVEERLGIYGYGYDEYRLVFENVNIQQ